MTNEGYRKRLEEWEATQRRMKDKQAAEEPYNPKKMPSQAPWGCLFLVAAIVIYVIGALAGYWKRFF